jgi:uncharacterized membrane protein YcgQ (UPF0703/DUF1980 family)
MAVSVKVCIFVCVSTAKPIFGHIHDFRNLYKLKTYSKIISEIVTLLIFPCFYLDVFINVLKSYTFL